jgi:hypothetical protein
MKYTLSDKLIAWLALLSGLTISAVAIYYSVAGLVAIFAAAAIPIIVMGAVLEVSKLIATVWLKVNWQRAPIFIRTYLLIAITILMLITSMGIFGFLSKAHNDQSIVSGDVQAKISLIDEKIKIERENISNAQEVIKQMDAAVNGVISTGDQTVKLRDGSSRVQSAAERSLQIRRSQAKDRDRLTKEIESAQSRIIKLQEEAAPIRAEMREVEAKVGPIKYIAAFVYGDNPDTNLLEKAVTWVIIIIVLVFDPLAVILLLASQYSFQWFRSQREEEKTVEVPTLVNDNIEKEAQLIKEANEKIAELDPPEPEFFIPEELTEPLVEPVKVEPTFKTPIEEIDDEEVSYAEKEAMRRWKEEHPEGSLKHQRRLLALGEIKELPWAKYIEEETIEDEAAQEAAKWAREQSSKKKDPNVDGEGREPTDQKEQRDLGYVQNAEQNNSTLWQRVKRAKGE